MALTVAQLVARVTADTSGFYRSMAIMNSSLIRTGGIASRVMAGVGLATLGVGIITLRVAGNYEQSMNILQAVSGATANEMKKLDAEAIALGKDFKLPNVSAKDAADAMLELSKGGLSVNRTLGATRGTLQLGLAANIGFAESGKLVARTLKAFDLAGTDATRVANVYAAAANKSTAEIYDLALGTQNAAAQFHGVGYSLEDLNASLAILADNGLAGEYAGTALKTMLIRLISPTGAAQKVMKQYGIDIFDATGKMRAMPAVIKEFTSGLGGLTQEQREQALTTIFGVRANQAMRILMGESAKGYLKYRDAISDTNAAQEIAEARTKGFNGAMGALSSAVETLFLQLGKALLPAATKVTFAMANFVNSIDPNVIIGFFSAIKDGVVWIYKLIAGSEVLQYGLAALAGAFVGLYVAQKVIAIIKAVQMAWLALNASFALSPIGLVVIAIAALVAALVLAYMKVEWFRNAVNGAFAWLKDNVPPIIQAVVDFVMSAFSAMSEWVSGVMDDITAVISTAWKLIGPMITSALKVILKVWEMTWGQMISFISEHWKEIASLVGAVLKNVLIIVQGVLNTIKGVINVVMGVIRGDWSRAWDGIKQILQGTLGTIFNLIKNTLTNIVPKALSLAIEVGKSIWNGIKQGLADLPGLLWNLLQTGIVGVITRAASSVIRWATAIGHAFVSGIIGGMGGLAAALWDKIKGAATSAIGWAVGWLRNSPEEEVGKELSAGIVRGYLLGQNDLPNAVKENIRKALEEGKKVIEQYQSIIAAAFSRLAEDAFYAFDQVTQLHKTAAEKALAAFERALDVKAQKERIQELVAAVTAAQQELASFERQGFVEPTREEGETEEAYQQRKLEALRAYEEERARLLAEYEVAQSALEEEKEQQRIEKTRTRLQKKAENERRNYEERRRLQRRHLEDELADLETYLNKHPEQWRKVQKRIISLLNGFAGEYQRSGYALSKWFVEGFSQNTDAIIEAARALAEGLKQYLKLHSNAEKGPLSDLESWWTGFAPALLKGLDTDAIHSAAERIGGMPYGVVGGRGAYASAGYTPAVVNHYYIEGSLISEQDLNDRIRKGIIVEERRGRTISV